MMWFQGWYLRLPKNNLPKEDKDPGVNWEEELERRYDKCSCVYHLLTHFQCDICHFWNIQVRYIEAQQPEYESLMITA